MPGAILDNPVTTASVRRGRRVLFRDRATQRAWLTSQQLDLLASGAVRRTACLMAGALILGLSQFTTPFLYFQF